MKDFTKGFNWKLVGLRSFARLGNLSLEANSLRLRRFNQRLHGKSEGLGNLSTFGRDPELQLSEDAPML